MFRLRVCARVIVCPVAARASQRVCLRATKSIASYRDGPPRKEPQGLSKKCSEFMFIHEACTRAECIQTDAYVRTHTLAVAALNDSELRQGSLRGPVGGCLR